MKTKITLLASLLLSSTNAFSDVKAFIPGPYIKANIGVSVPTGKASSDYGKSFSTRPAFGFALGYALNENLSTDLQLNYRPNFEYSFKATGSHYTQKISATSAMLNGYYTFTGMVVMPYLTAGLGRAFHSVGDYVAANPDKTSTITGRVSRAFAWQVGTGFQFKILEGLSLDVGYRYVDLGTFETTPNMTLRERIAGGTDVSTGETDPQKGALRNHEVLAGISYKF